MVKVKDVSIILHALCYYGVVYHVATEGQLCKQIDNCRCQNKDNGDIVDITSVGNGDGTPRFKDILSPDGYLYSYNPCKPFEEGICKNAAVCKKDKNTGEALMAGSADMPQFTYDEMTTDTVIAYTAGTLGEIHTFVYILCDDSPNPGPPQFYANGTIDANLFLLSIRTPCACGGRCDANGLISPDNDLQLGVGTFICIGLLGVVLLYLIIGSLFMKFVKKASGRHVIPNSDFWVALPNNVKNGGRYILSKFGASVTYSDV